MRRGVAGLALTVLIVAGGGEVSSPMSETSRRMPAPRVVPVVDEARPAMPPPAITVPRPTWSGLDSPLPKGTTMVALVRSDTPVYAQPDDPEPALVLPLRTILGTATVLTLVSEPVDGWAQVMLPMRPNGSTGWIVTDEVELYVVGGEIVVDLSKRTLVYYLNGAEILNSAIAVGRSGYPTPTGRFFVTDSVTLSKPGGPWGPHALGLSARSDTITEYNGGDGIIGIHGTNDPSSIGTAASLGCIRLPNDLMAQLHAMVPIGTPVEIRA